MNPEPEEIKYLSELSDQFEIYLGTVYANIISGIEENISGKRSEYILQKAGPLKFIFGKIKNWKSIIARKIGLPFLPFKIKGIQIYKKDGSPMSIREWEKIEKQINDHIRPYIDSIPEEMSVKGLSLGMAFANSELLNRDDSNETYNSIEQRNYSGYIPDTFDSIESRYKLTNPIKKSLNASHSRIAMYVTSASDDFKKKIRETIISGINRKLSPDELSRNLYDMAKDGSSSLKASMRDWRRVAYTELAQVHTDGKLAYTQDVAEKALKGKGKRIYHMFIGGTCDWCRSHQGIILLQVPEPKGGDDSLASMGIEDEHAKYGIWPGKNNVGKKKAEWMVCTPAHPHNTAKLVLIDPNNEKYDLEKKRIVSKVKNPFEVYIPKKFLDKKESLIASNLKREELALKDRQKGIHKKGYEYTEAKPVNIGNNIVEYGGSKYKSVSADKFSDELMKWRENRLLPIPVADNQREHKEIFGS